LSCKFLFFVEKEVTQKKERADLHCLSNFFRKIEVLDSILLSGYEE